MLTDAKQQYASRVLSFFESTDRACDPDIFNQTSLRFYQLKVQEAITELESKQDESAEIPINEVMVDLLATRTGLDILRRFARDWEQKKALEDPERMKKVATAKKSFRRGVTKLIAAKRFNMT